MVYPLVRRVALDIKLQYDGNRQIALMRNPASVPPTGDFKAAQFLRAKGVNMNVARQVLAVRPAFGYVFIREETQTV